MRLTAAGSVSAVPDATWAILVVRLVLGLLYFFAGLHKIVDVGPLAYGQAWATGNAARFLPEALIVGVGAVVPFVELALGAMVLLGHRTRMALRAMAAIIVCFAVGVGIAGLLDPFPNTAMDIAIVNRYIMPRAALTILALMLPATADRFSLDGLQGRGQDG
jgi:uncharacterized membrane protein YphA (DoxX/SURF4 family)